MQPNNIKINIKNNRWAVLRKKWEKYLQSKPKNTNTCKKNLNINNFY